MKFELHFLDWENSSLRKPCLVPLSFLICARSFADLSPIFIGGLCIGTWHIWVSIGDDSRSLPLGLWTEVQIRTAFIFIAVPDEPVLVQLSLNIVVTATQFLFRVTHLVRSSADSHFLVSRGSPLRLHRHGPSWSVVLKFSWVVRWGYWLPISFSLWQTAFICFLRSQSVILIVWLKLRRRLRL